MLEQRMKAIRQAWDFVTAAHHATSGYGSPKGQCAVTALLVQDWFGGDIVRGMVQLVDGGGYPAGEESHYWNRIPKMGDIDLTRDQYPATLPMPCGEVVPRSRLIEGDRAIAARTSERYLILKRRAEGGGV